jgi:hypothetical protein
VRNETSGINNIVRAMSSAPSGDNCQPFHFEVLPNNGSSTITIHHIEARGRHGLNRANHTSLVTLGTALELGAIQAASLGLKVETELTSDLGSSEHPHWATIHVSQPATQPLQPALSAQLSNSIFTRCTDRRLYRGGDFADPVFAEIRKMSAQFEGVQIHTLMPAGELLDFILKSEQYVWHHPSLLKDLLSWMRFSKKEKFDTRDGLYWNNLGVNWLESRLLLTLRKRLQLHRLFTSFGLPQRVSQTTARQLKSSAGILLFTLDSTSNVALVELGRAALNTWLALDSVGYGVQPMTSCAMGVFDSETGTLHTDSSEEYRHHFKRGRAAWAKGAGLNAREIPAWCFRVGRSSPLPEKMRTLRH